MEEEKRRFNLKWAVNPSGKEPFEITLFANKVGNHVHFLFYVETLKNLCLVLQK